MVDIKKLPKSEIEVKFSVAWEEWSKYIDAAVAVVAQSIKIEGFRQGKAPRALVERHVGRETVLSEAADRAIRKVWEHTVSEEKIQAIGHPKAEITKIAEGNPLEFSLVTAVVPSISLQKDWKKKVAEKNLSEKKKTQKTVEDKEVDAEIEKIAKKRAQLVLVSREAKKGDSVRIDFTVMIEGKVIEGGSAQNHALVLGSGVFIPGFEEQVEGMKAEEEKTFSLPFPNEYHEKTLAGKKADFTVKLGSVSERQIPELDDAFAVSLGNFKTMEEVKKSIREGMEKESAEKLEEDRNVVLSEVLVSCVETELPEVLLEEELLSLMREFEGQLTMMGLSMEGYLEHTKKSLSDIKNEWKPQAEKRLLTTLGLLHLAEEEELVASAEEIEEEMNGVLRHYKSHKEAEKKIDMGRLYTHCKEMILRRKAMEHMKTL